MAAFLTALAVKGETIEEITAMAASLRKHCVRVLNDMDCLEIVGTGGDMSHSFNISTTAAIVAGAAGIPVAKHGNRAATSNSGTADCFERLGVNIHVSPERSVVLLREIGICFLFAQNYHLSMKYVAPVRRELPIRTVFNILGPLVNPAGANMELLGVYSEELVKPLGEVMSKIGVVRGYVVHGQDGFDEITSSGPTSICEIRDGFYRYFVIEPEEFGMTRCKKEDLRGGTPEENAEITRGILAGDKGPKRDTVLLNAGAAIHIAKPEISMADGVKIAAEAIDSGKAMAKLQKFVELSNDPG
jgi:anthranilate phosphoribosyltransferase